MTKTYDPRKVVIKYNGQELTGFLSDVHYLTDLRSEIARAEPAAGSGYFSCTMQRLGTPEEIRQQNEALAYIAHNHVTGQPVTRHSGRGGSLIPDSAFSERRWNRPTSPGHAPRDEEDADRERLQTGCYHRRAVRHEGSDE